MEQGAADMAVEDSILPMNLVQLECPSDRDARALEHLYQSAAQEPWVLCIGDMADVPQATDLKTATQYGRVGKWTRGLLVQAAVMEKLGLPTNITAYDSTQLCAMLMQAFSAYTGTLRSFALGSKPCHDPLSYLQLWIQLDTPVDRSANHTQLAADVEAAANIKQPSQRLQHPTHSARAHKRRMGSDLSNGTNSMGHKVARAGHPSGPPLDNSFDSGDFDSDHRAEHANGAGLGFLPPGLHFKEDPGLLHPFGNGLDVRQFADGAHAQADGFDDLKDNGLHTLANVSEAYYGLPDDHSNSAAADAAGSSTMTTRAARQTRAMPAFAAAQAQPAAAFGRPSTLTPARPAPQDLEQCDMDERLRSVFHLPINDAAAALGMGVTVLKKECRERNIKRWPYRKLSSVDKLIESVKTVLEQDEDDAATKEAYQSLLRLRNQIFEDPSQDLNDWAKRLRQANFKQQYKLRNEK